MVMVLLTMFAFILLLLMAGGFLLLMGFVEMDLWDRAEEEEKRWKKRK